MNRTLVTGSTGFIGEQLVRHLINRGDEVTCLVRETSNTSALEKLRCNIVKADIVSNPAGVAAATQGCNTVYHLAAATRAVNSADLIETNLQSMQNILDACIQATSNPKLIYVSSVAAHGPNTSDVPHNENADFHPVSFYGRSKVACEQLARQHADEIPISIVRPRIVLGTGDQNGLMLFSLIAKTGWHFVPTFATYNFSMIHVDDLVIALTAVADRGKRLVANANENLSQDQGVYFASTDTMTYSILGRKVGEALGRKRTRVLRVAKPCMWVIAAFNELKGRVLSTPQYLNFDKYNEATAGSWACSNEKIKAETGFVPATTFQERLKQTVDWYQNEGWLDRQNFHQTSESDPQNHSHQSHPHQPAT